MYDKAKFLRFIATDGFLAFVWTDRQKELAGHPKSEQKELKASYLRAMFNSYVLDDSVMTRAYEAA